jgi:hypothetical protein
VLDALSRTGIALLNGIFRRQRPERASARDQATPHGRDELKLSGRAAFTRDEVLMIHLHHHAASAVIAVETDGPGRDARTLAAERAARLASARSELAAAAELLRGKQGAEWTLAAIETTKARLSGADAPVSPAQHAANLAAVRGLLDHVNALTGLDTGHGG